jgi:hypothetical protein
MELPREELILRSSVPLRRLANDVVTGSASGCLIDYQGSRILLTVEHATGDQLDWAIQLRFDASIKKTQLYRIGAMNFLTSGVLGTQKLKTVDFAYAKVPSDLKAYRQNISEKQELISEAEISVFAIDFATQPSSEDNYGFAGLVKTDVEMHPNVTFVSSELRAYDSLTYLRTQGDKLVFKLPFNHPGHLEFKGCSGAPIINATGMPVALLTGGSIATNEIYGISLAMYRSPIDILLGKFG